MQLKRNVPKNQPPDFTKNRAQKRAKTLEICMYVASIMYVREAGSIITDDGDSVVMDDYTTDRESHPRHISGLIELTLRSTCAKSTSGMLRKSTSAQ